MKENRIELKAMVVSQTCRTYSYSVHGIEGPVRDFIVEISLTMFTKELKFQDGPLITRERLITELASELAGVPARPCLEINELDILRYANEHSPKPPTWKRFQQREE